MLGGDTGLIGRLAADLPALGPGDAGDQVAGDEGEEGEEGEAEFLKLGILGSRIPDIFSKKSDISLKIGQI